MQSNYEPIVLAQCDFIEDIESVKRLEDAKQLTLKRKTEIDTVNTNFNMSIKNYIDSEDIYLKDIQAKSEALNHLMDAGLKLLDKKNEASLDQELSSAQKEFKQLEQKMKNQEEQEQWARGDKEAKQNKLGKLVDEIQLSILLKLDLPEPDNKSGVVFNWIVGCLIQKKMGAIQLAETLQLKVERLQLQPESIINQPAPPQSGGLFACGGRKPQMARPMKRQALPEEEQRFFENLFAWKAIKAHVFHQDFKLQEKVKEFIKNAEKLEPYQIMLVEEMVSERKEIIKGIFDIDIKDQARILIEINEIVLEFLLEQQKKQQEKQKEQLMDNLDKNLRQKNVEIQIMQQQKAYIQAKEKRVTSLKNYFSILLKQSNEIIAFTKDKISGNDVVIQQIEMSKTQCLSKELKVNQDVEEYYRRKRQEQEEKLFEEDQKRIAEEERLRKEKEEKDKLKDNNQQAEPQEDQPPQSHNNDEEKPAENAEDDYQTDSQYSDADGDENQDWIAPSQDEETRHIQQTLFPEKLKTAENKNLAKQKNQAESLLSLMAKRKKN